MDSDELEQIEDVGSANLDMLQQELRMQNDEIRKEASKGKSSFFSNIFSGASSLFGNK